MKDWRRKQFLFLLLCGSLLLNACGGPYSYKPSGKGRFPAVIVLHGRAGIRQDHLDFASDLSRAGYVTSVVDYGLDLKPIVDNYDRLRMHPDVDPERIGMAGFSQGTEFALQFTLEHPDRKIRGIVNYYSGCPGCWYTGRVNYPPSLFLHGELDNEVYPKELTDFCEMQQKMNKVCEAHIYKGVYHAFTNDSPAYPGGLDHVTSRDAFKRAVAFFDKYVKGRQQ